MTDGRLQFRAGAVIGIGLEFSRATPRRFAIDGTTYDRSGRLTIDEFVVDRIDEMSDPMLDYFGSIGGYIGGGIRGIGVLDEKPFTVKLELNEWFGDADDRRPPGRCAGPRRSQPIAYASPDA